MRILFIIISLILSIQTSHGMLRFFKKGQQGGSSGAKAGSDVVNPLIARPGEAASAVAGGADKAAAGATGSSSTAAASGPKIKREGAPRAIAPEAKSVDPSRLLEALRSSDATQPRIRGAAPSGTGAGSASRGSRRSRVLRAGGASDSSMTSSVGGHAGWTAGRDEIFPLVRANNERTGTTVRGIATSVELGPGRTKVGMVQAIDPAHGKIYYPLSTDFEAFQFWIKEEHLPALNEVMLVSSPPGGLSLPLYARMLIKDGNYKGFIQAAKKRRALSVLDRSDAAASAAKKK